VVSRESPDKEVSRRPTSVKKFAADALRGPRVSIIIIIIKIYSHQEMHMKSANISISSTDKKRTTENTLSDKLNNTVSVAHAQ